MATLGVPIEVAGVTAISAQDLLTTRDCVVSGCVEAAEPGLEKCRRHSTWEERRDARLSARGDGAVLGEAAAVGQPAESGAGLSVSEPERAAAAPNARAAAAAARRTTKEQVLAAFRRFHDERGRWPLDADRKTAPYLPGRRGVERAFGSWQAAWDAVGAGKVPTGAGARKYLQSSGRDPEGSADRPAEAATAPAEPPAPRDAVASRTKAASPVERASRPESSEPAALRGSSGASDAARPSPIGDDGGSAGSENPHAFAIVDLLALIRDLDAPHEAGYLAVMRWDHEGSGEEDDQATALVRRLARAALDQADPAAIGNAVLQQLDQTP